jgi:hypothetical protein
MTILEKELNRKLGSSGPAAKFGAFATSQFVLTAKIAAENEDWTPSRIAARQEWMAHEAVKLWRIPRLHEGQPRTPSASAGRMKIAAMRGCTPIFRSQPLMASLAKQKKESSL